MTNLPKELVMNVLTSTKGKFMTVKVQKLTGEISTYNGNITRGGIRDNGIITIKSKKRVKGSSWEYKTKYISFYADRVLGFKANKNVMWY